MLQETDSAVLAVCPPEPSFYSQKDYRPLEVSALGVPTLCVKKIKCHDTELFIDCSEMLAMLIVIASSLTFTVLNCLQGLFNVSSDVYWHQFIN